MLVITRREGEQFVLETSDGPVTVKYMGKNKRGSGVSFAIDAPDAVRIFRGQQRTDDRREAE